MADPKHSAGYRVGIVNPLTLVGNEIKTVLRERSFPYERLVLLDTTGKAGGALTEIGDEPAVVIAASDDELEDCDVVFFCGNAQNNREWLERYEEDEFLAIDLSQPAAAEEAKVIVAGVNLESAADERLAVSPHPIAIPIALLLHQISTLSRVEACTASVVQPASEFDQAGVEEMAQQTIAVLNIQTVPKEIFDRQIAFNLYPAAERNEERIVSQIKSLTSARAEIALFVTQGTIFHGHTFSLFIRTEEELDVDAIAAKLRENAAIALPEGDEAFGTIDAAGRDEVLVADVRRDPSIRGGFWVWAVCDNLRRGSALNAVLVAEKLMFSSGITN
jgi:aspartate-semialdehyde dehydrogenase